MIRRNRTKSPRFWADLVRTMVRYIIESEQSLSGDPARKALRMVNPTRYPPHLLDTMAFADRLVAARKQCNLTPQALTERADIQGAQIRRYEAGTNAPTLDALRNLAIALNVTTDSLVLDEDERGPSDDLALQFEAARHLDGDDQQLVRSIIETILLRHDTRRWTNVS